MKRPEESEVTCENYKKLGKEYTKGWKSGDQIKVLYKANDPERGYSSWVSEMSPMIGQIGTFLAVHSDAHIEIRGPTGDWWYPWYVLENVSRQPETPTGETKAINDLKAKMDLLTRRRVI